MYLRSKTQGRLRCQKRRSLPQPVKKPQNHFHEYRQKVTVTTLFQTAFHRIFQSLAQTAHVCLHPRKRVHTRLSEKDCTQGHTRRNRWRFGWGWYHYPRSVSHVHKHPRAGCQNGKLCRFWVLVGDAPEERRKPSGQRCAYACRCPTGVAAPLGCVIFFRFCRNCGLYALRSGAFRVCEARGGITTLSALYVLLKRRTAACQNGSFAVF